MHIYTHIHRHTYAYTVIARTHRDDQDFGRGVGAWCMHTWNNIYIEMYIYIYIHTYINACNVLSHDNRRKRIHI